MRTLKLIIGILLAFFPGLVVLILVGMTYGWLMMLALLACIIVVCVIIGLGVYLIEDSL